MKKKVLVSSVLTILLALSLIAGATFALFTSESRTNIAITSGKVSVIAEVDQDSIMTKQLGKDYDAGSDNTYAGEVTFSDNAAVLNKFVPGDGVKFNVKITNNSNIPVLYRVKLFCTAGETGTIEGSQLLFSALNFKVGGTDFSDVIYYASAWTSLAVGAAPASVEFEIELPEEAGNEYQDLETKIVYTVEAVQGNAELTAGEEIIRLDGSASLTDNGVTLDIPAGALEGDEPDLSVRLGSEVSNFEVIAGGNFYKVLDITLAGLHEENTQPIVVLIPVSSPMLDAAAYYNDGTSLQPLATENVVIGGRHYIKFTTTHFSEYVLCEREIVAMITPSEGKKRVYFDWSEALRSASLGDVVTLHRDATAEEKVLITEAITIDLAEFNADNTFELAQNCGARFVVRNQSDVNKAVDIGFKNLIIGSGISEAITVTGNDFTISGMEKIVFNAGVRMLTINGDNNTVDGLDATTTLSDSERFKDDYAIYLNGKDNTVQNCTLSLGGTATWGATVYVRNSGKGGTTLFKNVIIGTSKSTVGFRCIQMQDGLSGTVIIEDCVLTPKAYTFNVDGEGNGEEKLIVKNTVLNGWTSYSSGYNVEFVGCTFSAGHDYNAIAAYSDTTFTNCAFTDSIKIYSRANNVTLSFNNCTYNGVKITPENHTELFTVEGEGSDTVEIIVVDGCDGNNIGE